LSASTVESRKKAICEGTTIGLSLILCDRVSIGSGSRIGHGNIFRNLKHGGLRDWLACQLENRPPFKSRRTTFLIARAESQSATGH